MFSREPPGEDNARSRVQDASRAGTGRATPQRTIESMLARCYPRALLNASKTIADRAHKAPSLQKRPPAKTNERPKADSQEHDFWQELE